MAATNKDELLGITVKEFEKLSKLIADVDIGTAMSVDDEDTSIKDVIAHRAHWIGLFLGWYANGLAGKDVEFPAPGYKWNELKRNNADLRRTQSNVGWGEAQVMFADAHQTLIDFVDRRSDDDLYGAPMVGANNQWTPGRWAEAAGPSHYRSASKYVRARLRG